MAKSDEPRPQQVPDTARVYERARPESESPGGKLEGAKPPVHEKSDQMHKAVGNRTKSRQLNSQDVVTDRPETPQSQQDAGLPPQPDHSMKEEEPTGWDQAPQDIQDPKMKRHPRTEGKGGLA